MVPSGRVEDGSAKLFDAIELWDIRVVQHPGRSEHVGELANESVVRFKFPACVFPDE